MRRGPGVQLVARRARRRLRHDLVGDISRQFARAVAQRRDRRLLRPPLGVPDDRDRDGRQPRLGLSPGSGIRSQLEKFAAVFRVIMQRASPSGRARIASLTITICA